MNTVSTSPASAGSPQAAARPPRSGEATERPPHPRDRQCGEEFERLLRDKAARHEEEEEANAGGTADAPLAPTFVTWALPLPPRREGGEGPAAGAAGGAACEAAAGRAKQAHDVAHAQAETPQPLAAPANAAGAWELTLRQPLAASVDVKATRNAEAANGWSLSIASPTLDASVLARHAPRLNERLKARALSNTHVRIEERDEEGKS